MRDRSALEFTQVGPGTSAWSAIYGNTTAGGGQGSIGVGMPWFPLILQVNGTSCPEFEIVVKGQIEVLPPHNSFLYRCGRVLPSPSPAAESAWMARQRVLAVSGLQHAPQAAATEMSNRSAGGYLGAEAEPQKSRVVKGAIAGAMAPLAKAAGRKAGKAILSMIQGPQAQRQEARQRMEQEMRDALGGELRRLGVGQAGRRRARRR